MSGRLLVLGTILLVTGCPSSRSPEDAVAEIEKKGIQRTPDALVAAARKGDDDIVALLLDSGMDPNSKAAKKGRTALHQAALGGHVGVIKLLLDRGADIEARDHMGNTPLQKAALGSLPAARLLVERGAVVDAQSDLKARPLSTAAHWGRDDIVVLFINNGADVNAKDQFGRTALYWAKQTKRTETIALLKEHGAQ